MTNSKQLKPTYTKSPSKLTNSDVKQLISDYISWLYQSPTNLSWSQFCKQKGIKNPYQLKDYLTTHFTGLNNTIDFNNLWSEAERIREDKLIELGIFSKDVNANFLLGLMKSKFGWHENTVVVGVSPEDIVNAKHQALKVVKDGKN